MRVLLAEDEQMLGESLGEGLRHLGFTVDWVQDGIAAEQALDSDEFDALLLDLGLPGQDGMVLLEKLRGRGSDLPVLIITARDRVEDRIGGLDTGADDYLVKPFDLKEVAARLRAITRRRVGHASPVIEHAGIILDPASRKVTFHGTPVALTGYEYVILEALLSHLGTVVSRSRLLECLYGWDEGAESNVLEVCIHHLRRKLDKQLIQTIRGVGYTIRRVASEHG